MVKKFSVYKGGIYGKKGISMSAKEKKAFVARMKKGKAAATKIKSKSNTISKKALLNNLDLLENDVNTNKQKLGFDTSQKTMKDTIMRLKEQVKKM